MIALTDLQTASATRWDAVIVGSSFSAMFFLRGLPEGARVLVVEKGALVPHHDQTDDKHPYREDFARLDTAGPAKTWVAHTMFGGNSNCWWAQTPRFLPSDFALFETHGRGGAWPLDYKALEPYYAEVEQIMEIAGGGTDHLAPRSRPFSFPPHPLSRADQACHDWRPDLWVPVATARSNGGRRAICCTNGICHACPIDAKFTVLNAVDDLAGPSVRLLLGTEARRVETEAGQARRVVLRRRDGEEAEVSAPLIALGANAIFNASILMRSGLGGPTVGRYLHEQTAMELDVDVAHGNYFGGSSISAHCYGAYDGPHRRDAAAVLIESYNAPVSLRLEPGRWTDRMRLKLLAEDEPQARNRVVLDDRGEPAIEWFGHSAYAEDGLQRALRLLPDLIPFEIERIEERTRPETEAHIQGTHRMGTNPASSVVDAQCRVHGQRGLYALGAGTFPTSAPANPTLTLSALSLMAGRSAT